MADGAAAGEWDYKKWGVAGEHKELSVTEILQALGKDPMWMWVDVNGTPKVSLPVNHAFLKTQKNGTFFNLILKKHN